VKKSLLWTVVILALCGCLNWLRIAPPRFRGDIVETAHWMRWDTKVDGIEMGFGRETMTSLFHEAGEKDGAGVIVCDPKRFREFQKGLGQFQSLFQASTAKHGPEWRPFQSVTVHCQSGEFEWVVLQRRELEPLEKSLGEFLESQWKAHT